MRGACARHWDDPLEAARTVSAPDELRLPFFKEGIHALFLIDTAKKRDKGLAFERKGCFERSVRALLQHFLDGPYREWGHSCDRFGQFERA